MFTKLIIAVLLITAVCGTQYVPIPNVYDGVTVGNPAAKLHIEAFFDLLCPDSKASNAVFNKLFTMIDNDKIAFTYHLFPLPYHI